MLVLVHIAERQEADKEVTFCRWIVLHTPHPTPKKKKKKQIIAVMILLKGLIDLKTYHSSLKSPLKAADS